MTWGGNESARRSDGRRGWIRIGPFTEKPGVTNVGRNEPVRPQGMSGEVSLLTRCINSVSPLSVLVQFVQISCFFLQVGPFGDSATRDEIALSTAFIAGTLPIGISAGYSVPFQRNQGREFGF